MISALYWGVLRSKIKHKSEVHSQITISTALLTDIQTDRRTESEHSAVESVNAAGQKEKQAFSLVILMTIYNLCNLCTLRNLCQSDEYQKLIRDSFSSAEDFKVIIEERALGEQRKGGKEGRLCFWSSVFPSSTAPLVFLPKRNCMRILQEKDFIVTCRYR